MAKTQNICEKCRNLLGAGRLVQPHPSLVLIDAAKFSSLAGASEKTLYQCRICGQKWRYETGSIGTGWAPD